MKYLITAILTFICSTVGVFGQAPEPIAKEVPSVSYGFVVDNSGSYRAFLERIITIVKSVADANAAGDETFLVTFVDNAKTVVRAEFTADKNEIKDAAENMFIEGGLTTVLDAVRLSVDYLAANSKDEPGRRRALVLITDGDDRSSSAKIEAVIAAAKNANVRIVVIGMSEEKLNTKLLDRLARETGGRTFYPKTPKESNAIGSDVAAAIRGN